MEAGPNRTFAAKEVIALTSRSARQKTPGSQAGVSLVEVIIAMFILALMSVGVLPLLIGGIRASVSNRDLVAATSAASAQLAALQAKSLELSESCGKVEEWVKKLTSDPDPSGITAQITLLEPCPPSESWLARKVKVTASRPGSTQAVVTLYSAILVTSP